MNLRSIDLNLLVALNALLTDRHVTRAADKIGLSQPAMSNALSRLRHIFKDDLLVRTAAGMQATPRALELTEPVRQVLRQIERVLDSEPGFDPATSSRSFTLRLSDLLGLLLLPRLSERLNVEAPGLEFDIIHASPTRTVEALEKDEVDMAVSMGLIHATSIRSACLMSDRMVCVMRRDHPLVGSPLSLDDFLAARQLKVSMSPTDRRFVDDVLSRLGLTRRVALNVPHWLLVPHVLERSDLLSVMPRRLALALGRSAMTIQELPFESDPFEWSMYWHRRHEGNQALVWLRQTLMDIVAENESG
ncbi:LysR family transcriptional regulator [Bosea sp. (in: a-proteobacteria)]|uniref:LysR family transcriptional regulator n=1 Tax=Bosea sp. (in: a-proteobacteria) TaxID=1871050 RepID=UPI00261955B7|nr:LysR family transcriptional regulator [Bosea sp. (in: a-proteobacteria)]MCO5089534.1 LysR family transcriptional regulator [Bosea sp. (in: a-proteobacteria)]